MAIPNDGTENEPKKTSPGPPCKNKHHFKFTEEQIRVFRECKKESFYQRSLPISVALGAGTYYGVKSGYLKPNSRFGPIPKVAIAVICGYFIGKVSYWSTCINKLKQLPNSQGGDMQKCWTRNYWKPGQWAQPTPKQSDEAKDPPAPNTKNEGVSG